MTMNFGIATFAAHLVKLSIAGTILTDAMLEHVGAVVEKAAKDKIGDDEQAAAGPFASWAPLAQSTIEEKEYLGYVDHVSANDSLLRTGELRDSIEHKIGHQEVHIGSDSPVAEYQELGTSKIPPRSFLGGAAFEQTPKIIKKLGVEMEAFLIGKTVVGGRMKIE
jgi:HK97 gp10 family phage protein